MAYSSWCRQQPKCSCVQSFEQFTVGSEVGFTDAYHRQFAGKEELAFSDWIVADRNKESCTITIQRHGLPHTKFVLGWSLVYLK